MSDDAGQMNQLTPIQAIGTVAEAIADALLSACAATIVIHHADESPDTPIEPVSTADIRALAIHLIDRVIERTKREGAKPE